MNNPSPFNDPNVNPLPDANDIERQTPPRPPEAQIQSTADRQRLQRLFITLLGIGLGLGLLTATGIVLLLDRLEMIGVPNPPEQLQTD